MENKGIDRTLLQYSPLGLEFAFTLGLFTLAGVALDKKLGTLPGYTIFLAACGFGLGLYRLISSCNKISKRNSDSAKDEGKGV